MATHYTGESLFPMRSCPLVASAMIAIMKMIRRTFNTKQNFWGKLKMIIIRILKKHGRKSITIQM